MGRALREFLKKYFPADGLGWKIPSLVAAIIAIVGVVTALIVWARDALSDFLTTDVAVWHLLLTVGAAVIVALLVWWFARWQSGISEGGMTDTRPVEVEKFGVLWPIIRPRGGTLQVGKPMCLTDRSTLAQFVEDKLVSLLDDWDDSMTGPEMSFGCPKEDCGRKYDLTGHKYHMADMVNLVHDVAMGEWRAASRQHG